MLTEEEKVHLLRLSRSIYDCVREQWETDRRQRGDGDVGLAS
jgi:hypothetical protein